MSEPDEFTAAPTRAREGKPSDQDGPGQTEPLARVGSGLVPAKLPAGSGPVPERLALVPGNGKLSGMACGVCGSELPDGRRAWCSDRCGETMRKRRKRWKGAQVASDLERPARLDAGADEADALQRFRRERELVDAAARASEARWAELDDVPADVKAVFGRR